MYYIVTISDSGPFHDLITMLVVMSSSGTTPGWAAALTFSSGSWSSLLSPLEHGGFGVGWKSDTGNGRETIG